MLSFGRLAASIRSHVAAAEVLCGDAVPWVRRAHGPPVALPGYPRNEAEPNVGFALYDERPDPERLLYRSAGFDPRARFTKQATVDVAGQLPHELIASCAALLGRARRTAPGAP